MLIDIPEESVTVAWAVKHGRPRVREHAHPWHIGKRGTVFTNAPDPALLDLYKDVTHLYRDRQSAKKPKRTEWGTTLWIDNADFQELRSPAQVRLDVKTTLRILQRI
jgi:hypothetical protein